MQQKNLNHLLFHTCDDCYVLTMRHNRVNCVEKKAMMRLFGFLVCPELPEALMEIVSSCDNQEGQNYGNQQQELNQEVHVVRSSLFGFSILTPAGHPSP